MCNIKALNQKTPVHLPQRRRGTEKTAAFCSEVCILIFSFIFQLGVSVSLPCRSNGSCGQAGLWLKRCLILIIFFSALAACIPQEEKPPLPPFIPPPETIKEEPVIEQEKIEKVQTVSCKEDTAVNFNKTGIMTSPFIKVVFYDMNKDGLADMIAGDKYGQLVLYENPGDLQTKQWKPIRKYFDGIKISAFSAPAVGDMDGDSKPEIAVGTGGFSSESGRILFFRNSGTPDLPVWTKVQNIELRIGNDASATIVDYDLDGKPDIIAGNSEGKIFFFKNTSDVNRISFRQDKSLFSGRSFDMYAVPAAARIGDSVILLIGNSLGRLSMFEIKSNGRSISAKKMRIDFSTKGFVSPAFAKLMKQDRFDLLLADGDGVLSYYENTNNDFTVWQKSREMFNNRVFAGPVCTPTLSQIGDGRACMIIGNIDGSFKFYRYESGSDGLPWIENENYFKGVKVPGFSRGVLTQWQGRDILITGESSGLIRAFMKNAAGAWKEEKKFFDAVRVKQHSAPAVFDLDGDNRWELITGAEDGRIYAYRVKDIEKNLPVWERVNGVFDNIKVGGFSSPAILKDKNTIYLIIGQQDGAIRTFTAEFKAAQNNSSNINFRERDFLKDFKMKNHSSPFMAINGDIIEVVSGDYDGNIMHFSCEGG